MRVTRCRAQWVEQRARAQMLADLHRVTLTLYAVWHPEHGAAAARVSIVGGTIVSCAPALWRQQGARVHRLCDVTPADGGRGREGE